LLGLTDIHIIGITLSIIHIIGHKGTNFAEKKVPFTEKNCRGYLFSLTLQQKRRYNV